MKTTHAASLVLALVLAAAANAQPLAHAALPRPQNTEPKALQPPSGHDTPNCPANCDGSTTAPYLNVNDFLCVLSMCAAGQPYVCNPNLAPCIVPQYMCFMTAFAAGCSAP